ncbi:OPT family small oligopeptide transporter [Kwoniella newhampshirensis]|uniref:OPT family small oligopeptide transporter n=1 Tax=Kwoniella newhampshirensis TaxID=1651941 RepID=A0AAW0YY89_9TREE
MRSKIHLGWVPYQKRGEVLRDLWQETPIRYTRASGIPTSPLTTYIPIAAKDRLQHTNTNPPNGSRTSVRQTTYPLIRAMIPMTPHIPKFAHPFIRQTIPIFQCPQIVNGPATEWKEVEMVESWSVECQRTYIGVHHVECLGRFSYATDIIATQRFFYGQRWGWGYQILLVLGTQLLGFSFAGVLHRILVTPASMIWPSTLVNTALFNALHARSGPNEARSKARSRQVFFYVNAVVMFVWSFFPSYIFTALSNFDWVTWIKPDNQVINLLFGYQSGAGMSTLTFDWGMMANINNPLATPWWVTGNILGGLLFFIWFLAPIMYYTNVFYARFLPFSGAPVFDNTANPYNVSRVLTATMTLDAAAYETYSPVYMTVTSALSYGLNFAAITSTLVHSVLLFRKQVWHHLRHPPSRNDVHARLASAYPVVPAYWYLALFLINLALAITTIRAWPTQLPVLALFAVTNMQVGLNVTTEMIIGYAVPGKPVAMMIFKTYGYITTTQALGFTQDLKIAYYMHLPPQTVFFAQIVAAIIGSVVQLAVQSFLFDSVDDICPIRLFTPGSLYSPLLWFFLPGALLPIVTYILARRWPRSGWKYVCWPVVFSCISLLPPYLPINYISFCIAGFFTQYWVRRHCFVWWSRYNYTLSAAWTCGYTLCIFVIFFALQLPKNGKVGEKLQNWKGNTIYTTTLDGQGNSAAAAEHLLTQGEIFGLKRGTWH